MTHMPSPDRFVNLTPSAAKRVAELRSSEGNEQLMLRLSISGGGCAGFQYGFSLDDNLLDDDKIFERDGVKLVIDGTSLDLLTGSEVDFVEDLGGAAFKVLNPNAQSGCGCGSSFSV